MSLRSLSSLCTLLLLICASPSQAWATDEFRILYFEPISISSNATAQSSQKTAQSVTRTSKHIHFEAYGREFEIDLQPNPSLSGTVSADSGSVAYRGTITGVEGSWVRMTQTTAAMYGTLWDGKDLYVIEPAQTASAFAVAPLDMRNAQTVIYRLGDTLINLPLGSDDQVAPGPMNGAQALSAVTSELNKRFTIQAAGATKRIQIGIVGDAAFRAQYASDADANDAVLIRMNNVDGFYSAQLGIEIQTPSIKIYGTDPAVLTGATDPDDPNQLLSQVATLRRNDRTQLSYALTHLYTGRDLNGDTVGVAFKGTLCGSVAASLTESRGFGVFIDSLITAHEIGHNFGASHDGDGDPQNACGNVPTTFLMAARVSGNSQFSQCSLDQMQPVIQSATCIAVLAPADVALPAALSAITAHPNDSVTFTVPVTNDGGMAATNASATISIPGAFTITDAFVPGGSCVSGGGSVQCELGTITASAQATINITVQSSTTGDYTISGNVAADSDSNAANNATSLPVSVVTVQSAAPPPVATTTPTPPASSGGGGGAFNEFTLAMLSLLALLRAHAFRLRTLRSRQHAIQPAR